MKNLRKKTHIEAEADGSIYKMKLEKVRELVGYCAPECDERGDLTNKWDVTMAGDGAGYIAENQFEAEVVGSLEEVKLLLLKLLEKK